jgi:hypothetical protein
MGRELVRMGKVRSAYIILVEKFEGKRREG